MSMSVCLLVCVCTMWYLVPMEARGGHCRSPGTGIADGYEPPRQCWEQSLGSVFLKSSQCSYAEHPSLQPSVVAMLFTGPVAVLAFASGLDSFFHCPELCLIGSALSKRVLMDKRGGIRKNKILLLLVVSTFLMRGVINRTRWNMPVVSAM